MLSRATTYHCSLRGLRLDDSAAIFICAEFDEKIFEATTGSPERRRSRTPATQVSTARHRHWGRMRRRPMMARLSRLVMIACVWCVALGAMAQQSATAPTQPLLKPAELDQLVAPIALHPDPLLSEILIASTYPLEIVQADRWAQSNKALKGEALTAALA